LLPLAALFNSSVGISVVAVTDMSTDLPRAAASCALITSIGISQRSLYLTISLSIYLITSLPFSLTICFCTTTFSIISVLILTDSTLASLIFFSS
jgi:hypothetical protein